MSEPRAEDTSLRETDLRLRSLFQAVDGKNIVGGRQKLCYWRKSESKGEKKSTLKSRGGRINASGLSRGICQFVTNAQDCWMP